MLILNTPPSLIYSINLDVIQPNYINIVNFIFINHYCTLDKYDSGNKLAGNSTSGKIDLSY